MPLTNDNKLRIHVVDVGHGDAIILEFPDYNHSVHFGIVDAGRPGSAYKGRLTDYLQTLIDVRGMPFEIEFVCITHPHEDHYGGLESLLDRFGTGASTKIRQFWDCGFRTAAQTYNRLLARVADNDRIVFVRLSAGAEYEFGEVRIFVLGPSLDLRNRFDTYGVDRNNASVVLKVTLGRASAILAGDAHFDSWGKITEEFPRTSKISYFKDALVARSEGSNQLNCQLLKVSHHGSKHGTSLEYLEKLNPSHVMVTCADADWYQVHKPGWGTEWPHLLTRNAIQEINPQMDVRLSHADGHVVYHLFGGRVRDVRTFQALPDEPDFQTQLSAAL